MRQPFARCRGLGAVKFGILAGNIGEAVMRQVEVAEPFERQKDRQPAGPPHPVRKGLRPERRAVGAFVFQREQEHDQHALNRQQERPERNPCRDQRPDDQDKPGMPGQMP